LEIAKCIALEDFNILIPDKNNVNGYEDGAENNTYYLAATASAFPAGVDLCHKVGQSLRDLHKPVIPWEPMLGPRVHKRLSTVQFKPDEYIRQGEFSRISVFIQQNDKTKQFGDMLHALKGEDFYPDAKNLKFEDIILRRERQTFIRLDTVPGAILFAVRTYVGFLKDYSDDEILAFAEDNSKTSKEHALYKQQDLWMPKIDAYLAQRGLKNRYQKAPTFWETLKATVRGVWQGWGVWPAPSEMAEIFQMLGARG
jgi:hypothetical protein